MRRTASVLSLLLLLVSPALAAGPAADPNATQKARTSFHRGVQLYNEGSFEAALAEFGKAYQLSPNYKLLYNIAQTQFDLHDYVSSFRSLEQYLKEGGSEIAADRRVQVAELNRKLEERIAYVDVVCNVEGAEIRVDDLPVGISPLSAAVMVNAGPRRITVTKPGFTPVARMLIVAGADRTRMQLELVPSQELAEGHALRAAGTSAPAGIVQQREPTKKSSSRAVLISSAVLAGGCAVATGVFGILASQARNDFNRELKTIPNTKDKVDDARSKMKLYAHATDAFGVVTLISAGVALYSLLTDSSESEAPKASRAKRSVAIAPSVGGLVIQGGW